MIEAKIDASALDDLVKKLERSPQVIENARRKAFEAAAPKLKQEVDTRIGGTGKVRSWQEMHVGSRGGYAAVRAKRKTWTEATKKAGRRYAVGYVTNAINSGHGFPNSHGKRKRYYSTTEKRVAGKFFYQAAREQIPRLAEEAAGEIVKALTEHLEG